MRSSDWSSDVCSSDLSAGAARGDSPWAGPCRPAEPGRAKLAAGRSHDRAGEAGRQKRGSRDCGDGGSRRQRDMVSEDVPLPEERLLQSAGGRPAGSGTKRTGRGRTSKGAYGGGTAAGGRKSGGEGKSGYV